VGNAFGPRSVQVNSSSVEQDPVIRGKIVKIGNAIVYEYLRIYNNPIAQSLDYFEITYALCKVMEDIYRKLEHESSYGRNMYEAIQRIDSRLKHHFFGFIAKELDKVCVHILKDQVCDIDSLVAKNTSISG